MAENQKRAVIMLAGKPMGPPVDVEETVTWPGVAGGAQPRSRAWEEPDGSLTLELLSVEGLHVNVSLRGDSDSAQKLRFQLALAGIEVRPR